MTYSVTIAANKRDVVLPTGSRYQAGAVVTLTDEQYGRMPASAVASLLTAPGVHTAGGGNVSRTVTLKSTVRNVVLPNGIRYNGSAVVVLSDEQYSTISPAARAALFATDVTTP
jgi:hypothetical protein